MIEQVYSPRICPPPKVTRNHETTSIPDRLLEMLPRSVQHCDPRGKGTLSKPEKNNWIQKMQRMKNYRDNTYIETKKATTRRSRFQKIPQKLTKRQIDTTRMPIQKYVFFYKYSAVGADFAHCLNSNRNFLSLYICASFFFFPLIYSRHSRRRLQHCQHVRRCQSGRPRHVQKPHAHKLILQISNLRLLLHLIFGLPTLLWGRRPMGPSTGAPRSAPTHLQTLQPRPKFPLGADISKPHMLWPPGPARVVEVLHGPRAALPAHASPPVLHWHVVRPAPACTVVPRWR